MALSKGTRLGPYEISRLLAAGGMGEVYRARDSKLGRDVALKVLPLSLAQDRDYLARFQREAQALAALNHPNIATIYGLEENAIVMELVEGTTLAERITAGPVPLEEALAIARQIVEALEAAHERGIIHRDLKPANVKITTEGHVKVLDFGLAKLNQREGEASAEPKFSRAAGSQGSAGASPSRAADADAATQLQPATDTTTPGVIMGTAAYMAPEQATGKPVDKRADIWAFGVVLWEMLSGRKLFEGETTTEILASVVKESVDWSRLPKTTPSPVLRLLERCLERDRKKRLRDTGEARIAIEKYLADPAAGAEPKAVTPSSPSRKTGQARVSKRRMSDGPGIWRCHRMKSTSRFPAGLDNLVRQISGYAI